MCIRDRCLDIYKGKGVEEQSKRITFRITATNYNKTLDDKEIKSIVNNIQDSLSKEYGAKII